MQTAHHTTLRLLVTQPVTHPFDLLDIQTRSPCAHLKYLLASVASPQRAVTVHRRRRPVVLLQPVMWGLTCSRVGYVTRSLSREAKARPVMDVVSAGDTAAEDLRFRVPAVVERLHQLRRALTDWATRIGLAAEVVADLVLAAYEAMANVVEHAYRDCMGGLLDLHAHADHAHHIVTVTVTDYGRWRPPPPDPGPRGRGLSLIHGLTQHTEISSTQHGTTVTMTYSIAGSR